MTGDNRKVRPERLVDAGQDEGSLTTSHRETVMMAGRLKGMGCEAGCTVSAVKVSLPQLKIWEYVRCDIHLAPEHLPNGSYEVSFEGRTMRVKKLDGYWLDGSP
jgi:hypothetical protein